MIQILAWLVDHKIMNKEQWIQHRRTNQLNIEHLYEHYTKTYPDRNKISFDDFQKMIPHYLNSGEGFDQYLKHYDNEFEILYLQNKENKSIV